MERQTARQRGGVDKRIDKQINRGKDGLTDRQAERKTNRAKRQREKTMD